MRKIYLSLLYGLFIIGTTFAQKTSLDEETLKKANDPLAKSKAINLHNYVVSDLYGMDGVGQNITMLRYGQPLGKFLLRGTLPIMTTWSPGAGPRSGLGDASLFGLFTIDFKGNKIGFGPIVSFPTGTNNLGSRKWQAGVAAMAFLARNRVFQSGALLQWQASFAGKRHAQNPNAEDPSSPDINALTAQLFGILQLGGGAYLRSTGVWSFNLENGNFNIPLGLGIGKVVMINKVVVNIFAEPQFSVLAQGMGQPRFQLFIGMNTQF